MEVPVAALAVLSFTEALCPQACSASFGANTPTACCFSHISWQILLKFVGDYHETSKQCSKPAIIFLTKRGRLVYADPSEAWVQEHITNLEPMPEWPGSSKQPSDLSGPAGEQEPEPGSDLTILAATSSVGPHPMPYRMLGPSLTSALL
ncbi:C-C motif chemokine 3-like [Nycticebus coucang]|uniref:C-C motif chemokine 3-like n=1 Tax=Nycticebus coucang TaxID=9470 RepID=UPI00234DC16D|nr:C-C motif chemokine 3-like [Nycticebus coucang]